MFCKTSAASWTVLVNETINIPVSLMGIWLNKTTAAPALAAATLGESCKHELKNAACYNNVTPDQLCFLIDSFISRHFFTPTLIVTVISGLTDTNKLYPNFVAVRDLLNICHVVES